MLAIAGVIQPSAGRLDVASPVAHVPEDRTTEGLIPDLSLTENVVLGQGRGARWVRGIRIDWAAAARYTAELLPRFDVRAPGPATRAGLLSGGNQQKLVLARALDEHPRVLVAENPTRGLDLSATAAVHARLRAAADAGVAVLFHSSDLDEVLELADRVVVVVDGRVVDLPAGAGREAIGAAMLGVQA
jgi:general nucleoside transport system ATP-binding protein